MLARITCIALLAWPVYAHAETKQVWNEEAAAKLTERTKVEARAVLGTVLRDDKIAMTPCLLDTQWSTRPVSVDIAQIYLGSSLNADVIASHLGVSPIDMIDPDNMLRGSECSGVHADALWRQMVDDFRSGANPGEHKIGEGSSSRGSELRLLRMEITMPVFDRTFTTAAVVIGYSTLYTRKIDPYTASLPAEIYDERGYYRRLRIEGFGHTYVYRKRGGRWMRVHETDDWSAH